MFGAMYLMAVFLGLIMGLHILEDSVGRVERERLTFRFWRISVSLGPVLIMLFIVLFLDLTYGSYIGSFRLLLWLSFIALLVGFVHSFIVEEDIILEIRVVATVLLVLILLISGMAKYIAPDNLEDNDLYKSLSENKVKGENPNPVTDEQEIRVISWELATDYLQRAYGDSGSYLATDGDSLMKYTDPSYLDNKFVWVNAPKYEFLKWTGDKKVPFYIYISNDPANMTSGKVNDTTHKMDVEMEAHKTRIAWENRLEQILFSRYAGKYEISQIRIDVDDDKNPWWIVYLARRDTWYSMHYLEKILLVNTSDVDDIHEYDVNDKNIPEWLEVVYPDEYVYRWVSFWGTNRMGLGYRWFNKGHLYDPDDSSARFIVINRTTYWHIPMAQKESSVLGGYVWVNTRTGEATFYNREELSLVDMDTAKEQIEKYLASGALGFQQLDIHEGYLYPFRMNDGHVREAYVFPMYAGLTIAKYAIVDAIEYTDAPVVDPDLKTAVDNYRSRVEDPVPKNNLVWEEYTLQAFAEDTDLLRMLIVVTNDTGYNHTCLISEYLVEESVSGNITSYWEWDEFLMALSRWERGDEIVLWMTINWDDGTVYDGSVLDIDWEGSSLVER